MSAKRTSVDFGDRSVEIAVPEHATVVEFDDPGALSHPAVAAREAIEKLCSSFWGSHRRAGIRWR